MLKIILSASLLILSGCTTTTPKQLYSPSGTDKRYEITGDYKPFNGWNGSITIKIDNKEVINSPIPSDSGFELSGNTELHKIDALCNKNMELQYVNNNPTPYVSTIDCVILFDNVRATTLTFK